MKIQFLCPHCKHELEFEDLSQDESPCPLRITEKYDPLDKRAHAENPAVEWKGR